MNREGSFGTRATVPATALVLRPRHARVVDSAAALPRGLRCKCACGGHAVAGEACEACQSRRPMLRRKSDGMAVAGVPAGVRAVIDSAGQPLERGARGMLEQRFGHDFSGVRVHADAAAAHSAREVNALAYTVGNHVAFAAGRYAPDSPAGLHLLAHELTHVVQQSGGEPGADSIARDEAEAERSANAVIAARVLPSVSAARPGLRKQDAPTASGVEKAAFGAESQCDLPALCRLHFAQPQTVDRARIDAAYRRCAPGVPTAGLDPCLSVASLPPSTLGPRNPNALPPVATGAGPGAGGGGGLHLPSTTLKFHLGDLQVQLDLPSSLTATLPLSYRSAQVVSFKIEATTSGDFSLSVTIDAVPHVRISLHAGVSVGGTPQGSAGLTIEAIDTVCRAEDPQAARASLEQAGKKLHDAVVAAQASAQPDKLKDVVAAIVGVNGAIDAAKAKCKQVPRVRLDLGVHGPLGPFTPHMPITDSDRSKAPYVGGTLTIPF